MSSISNTLGKLVPMSRRRPKMDKKEALAILPVRNALVQWERKGREVILTIPMRRDGMARIVKFVLRKMPDTRQIALDDVASRVWELCDGQRNINDVVSAISKEYKLERREAEASVTMFLQTLAKKSLIGLMSAGGKKSAKNKH